jgi:hypothetical protein
MQIRTITRRSNFLPFKCGQPNSVLKFETRLYDIENNKCVSSHSCTVNENSYFFLIVSLRWLIVRSIPGFVLRAGQEFRTWLQLHLSRWNYKEVPYPTPKYIVPDPNLDPDTPDPHFYGPPGSGSTSQTVWIRILLSSSKNFKKNLDSYCFVTSFGLFNFVKLCKYTFKK